MVLENSGTFKYARSGRTGIIYIPADICRDSQFPLEEGPVTIRIEDGRLIVEKA